MSGERFDVVVAGGGLTGCLAARTLAERGLRVLLAERKADAGAFNYCAEAVSARAIAPLCTLTPDLIAAPVDAGLLVGPGGVSARLVWPGAGFVLHRDRLMRRLFEQAGAAGADARLEHEVCGVVRDDGGALRAVDVRTPRLQLRVGCSALVAADGVASGVGRLAGVPTRLAVGELLAAAQVRVTGCAVQEGTLEFWLGDRFAPGGYAWVFPRGPFEANVGVAIVADRPSAGAQTATHWLKRFRKHRFGRCGKIAGYIVGGIPTVVHPRPTAAQGVVLAGDAARVPDPLSAAGIAEGMASGRLAALAVVEALAAGDLSASRLECAAGRFRAEHPGRRISERIRRIYDRLDDDGKAQLVRACRDAFHERRVDQMDPLQFFLRLLRGSPRLVRYARYLLPPP